MSRARLERSKQHEEGLGVALDGPDKAEAGECLEGFPASASSTVDAPVLEMADRRDLHSRDHSGRPGPIPGWGTILSPNVNREDNTTL